MSQIQPANSSSNDIKTGNTPLYNYGENQNYQVQTPNQTVNVTSPYTSQIYQYPQSSIYNDPSKQSASGVNIYIYNPSAMGDRNTGSIPQSVTYQQPIAQTPIQTTGEEAKEEPMPAAATNISEENNTKIDEVDPSKQKTKRIVELTDDYIKTLESYLRSQDKTVRESGIIELIKRFEEDITRYDDEALTALLNIALQDSSADNRLLAISAVESGIAHGNDQTIELLKGLESSDKLYGQEAKAASNALLKAASEDTRIVADYSPDIIKK